ncbi:hypothetical protein J6590_086438 [Homalodisca vitripennis]|nr:hypothetical protein J6590_094569 [Homalodisca vitripennis]KAG8334615.1 hypothetical protein J6590_086438 [Homalodisca vitripennis]
MARDGSRKHQLYTSRITELYAFYRVNAVTHTALKYLDVTIISSSYVIDYSMVVPIAERSKTLDFESALEIAQVRILSVTVALFISIIDLVLYRLSLLLCLIRSSVSP